MKKTLSKMTTAVLAAMLTLFGLSLSAGAQDDPLKHLTVQVELDKKARAAAEKGRFDQAIVLLRSALEFGELNILYLNLGRAQFKAGRCQQALSSYARALTAPSAPSPPAPSAEAIAKAVESYREELAMKCPGFLRVSCDNQSVEIHVEGKLIRCGDKVEVTPGPHAITGKLGDQTIEITASVAAMQELEVPLNFDVVVTKKPAEEAPEPAPVEVAQPTVAAADLDTPSQTPTLVWIVAGAGGALVTTGLGILISTAGDLDEIRAVSSNPNGSLEEYEGLKTSIENKRLASGLFVGIGAALATASVILYFSEGEEDSAVGFRLGLSPLGVTLEGSF